MFNIFWIIGILGLILIISGLFSKTRRQQAFVYIFGGLFLEIYSLYLGDIVFIVLQAVFTLVAVYEFSQYSKKKESWFKRIHIR